MLLGSLRLRRGAAKRDRAARSRQCRLGILVGSLDGLRSSYPKEFAQAVSRVLGREAEPILIVVDRLSTEATEVSEIGNPRLVLDSRAAKVEA